MKLSNLFKPTLPIAALRMMTGVVFFLHAAARIVQNSFSDFGNFLDSKGFIFGIYLAYTITAFELIGGVAMFLRYFVKWFCIGETIILVTGIFLVHLQNGWFVVGMSLGGVEYSVVLITILAAIFIAESKAGMTAKNIDDQRES
jgi:putative oxidoreductase